jgi:retinol dehydrogenase 14
VITGASGGVGKESARALASQGATVVIVGRDASRLAAVAQELGVQHIAGDIGSINDVKRIAAEVRARFQRLDVLVHNAAAIPEQRRETVDGNEEALAVNVLAPYLLTTELADLLKASAPSRVVFLIGANAPVVFDDLQFKTSYNGWVAYQRSKTASLLVLTELAQRFAGTGVVVNGAFPGIVATPGMGNAIAQQPSLGSRIALTLIRPFMRTPAKGAQSTIWVASAPELERETGKLWSIKKPLAANMEPPRWNNPDDVKRLIAELDKLIASPGGVARAA